MEKLLSVTEIMSVKCLFDSIQTYPLKYNAFVSALQINNLHRFFARPEFTGGNRINWFTAMEGEIVAYKDLDDLNKTKTEALLVAKTIQIRNHLKTLTDKSLANTIETFFEIPDFENNVFLVTNGNETNVILTQWGNTANKFNSKSGLISGLKNNYEFPMIFQVTYQDGSLGANETVNIHYNNITTPLTSNEQGIIAFDRLVFLNSPVQTYQLLDGKKLFEIDLVCDGRTDYYPIKIVGPQNMIFTVVDSNGIPQPEMSFTFAVGERKITLTGNSNAQIVLEKIVVDSPVKAYQIDNNVEVNVHQFVCKMIDNNFQLIIPAKPIPALANTVNVLLIDHKKKPIPSQEIKFTRKQKIEIKTTNENGKTNLEYNELTNGEIIDVWIERGKKKHSKKITYNDKQQEYILQLKKRNWWWLLLLLLLLPLLLLLEFEKTIEIQPVDSKTKQTLNITTDVSLKFEDKRFIRFSPFGFLTTDPINLIQKTDTTRKIARFVKVKYTLYSSLFCGSLPAEITASTICASGKMTIPFHDLEDNKLYQLPMEKAVRKQEFQVIDKDDNEPLAGAIVTIETTLGTDEKTSTPDGMVLFNKNVQTCTPLKIKATCYGYEDYVIDASTDTLALLAKIPMIPKKGTVKFWVKDSTNLKPIPGANCSLNFNGKSNYKNTITNINGKGVVGLGEFADLRVLAKISITASHPYYYPKTTAEYTVDQYIKLSNEERTILLKPRPNPILFRVVDSDCNNVGIGGANVDIYVNGSKQSSVTTMGSGEFSFSASPSDVISLVASHPDFTINDTKIKDKGFEILMTSTNQDDRTIPLNENEIEITFRDIDAATQSGLGGIENIVELSGIGNNSITGNGDGVFTVKGKPCTKISITAKDPSGKFDPNSYTVNNNKLGDLKNNQPVLIPLNKKAPPPPPNDPNIIPCTQQSRQNGEQGTYADTYEMVKNGPFVIDYDFDAAADVMNVKCGCTGRVLVSRKLRFSGQLRIDMSPCTGCTRITVEIIGNTRWEYTLHCPN